MNYRLTKPKPLLTFKLLFYYYFLLYMKKNLSFCSSFKKNTPKLYTHPIIENPYNLP